LKVWRFDDSEQKKSQVFMRERELDRVSWFTMVTPNTTNSGEQLSFTFFLLSDWKGNNFYIFNLIFLYDE